MKTLILVITAACGLPFLGIGLYEAYRSKCETKNFTYAPGTVVGNSYATVFSDGNISGVYLPVIEFALPDERKTRFTDQVGSSPPDYQIGTSLEVIYNPENPADARINSWKRVWLIPGLLITVALLPIIVGTICVRRLQL